MVRDALTPIQGQQMYLAEPSGLWCHNVKQRQDGKWSFDVINGYWTGVYDPATFEVYVNVTKRTWPGGGCAWVGQAPFPKHEYNDAIRWIEKQIACAIST